MNQEFQVITIAGNGEEGFQDDSALKSVFNGPMGICCSNDGKIYVTDQHNHRIRMIYNYQVSSIAGNGIRGFLDGNAHESKFWFPTGITCATDGRLYLVDYGRHRIRMLYDDRVTTIAGNGEPGFQDGKALEEALFNDPIAICSSNDGRLYISERYNQRIRMLYNNEVTTIAGSGQKGFKDGNALEAMFFDPRGLCCSNDGRVYVTDHFNNRIRIIYNNKVATIAGNGKSGFKDGNALEAMFACPWAICYSPDRRIYVTDQYNHRIRMIYNNQVTTIAGNGQKGFKDGNALNSMFNRPYGLCCSKDGKIFVADESNHRIRMIYNNQKPPYGFALLLDMREHVLSDCQISYNGITYHLHRILVNVRCPSLFDQSYFNLFQQSNISNESFESFVTFLYSNKFTKEYNQVLPTTIPIKNIVELIFLFELFMNCKSILSDLKTRLTQQLIEMLTLTHQEEEESIRELIVDVLPRIDQLKELIKTKLVKSNMTTTNQAATKMSYIEHCYHQLIRELQNRRSILAQHVQHFAKSEAVLNHILEETSQNEMKAIHEENNHDESQIAFGVELTQLSKLAFNKTNIWNVWNDDSQIENNTTIESSTIESTIESTLSESSLNDTQLCDTHHLDAWTRPDFIIKLYNHDEHISYHVHKLILCGRWKYFRSMIESGLKEANENEMTLSDDWNKSRFEKFMK